MSEKLLYPLDDHSIQRKKNRHVFLSGGFLTWRRLVGSSVALREAEAGGEWGQVTKHFNSHGADSHSQECGVFSGAILNSDSCACATFKFQIPCPASF